MFPSKKPFPLSKTALASAILAWVIVQVVPMAYILWCMAHETEIGVGAVSLVYVLAMVMAPLVAYVWDPLRGNGEVVNVVTARWRLSLTAVAVVLLACGLMNEYAMWKDARILEVCTAYAVDLSPILNGDEGLQERSFNHCVMSMDGSGPFSNWRR